MHKKSALPLMHSTEALVQAYANTRRRNAGTYDTPEVSHVGIYVGNDMMIHCGDPISYSNLNSSYWQEHLYCYGRLPERSS